MEEVFSCAHQAQGRKGTLEISALPPESITHILMNGMTCAHHSGFTQPKSRAKASLGLRT